MGYIQNFEGYIFVLVCTRKTVFVSKASDVSQELYFRRGRAL